MCGRQFRVEYGSKQICLEVHLRYKSPDKKEKVHLQKRRMTIAIEKRKLIPETCLDLYCILAFIRFGLSLGGLKSLKW